MKKDNIIILTVILLICLYLLLKYPEYKPLPEITAKGVSYILGPFFGFQPLTYNNIILLNLENRFITLTISPECSGILIISIFIFVIFITPKLKLKHKFLSLLFVPLIILLNIIRIALGVVVGTKMSSTEILLIFHNSFGQVFIFFVLIIVYIIFLKIYGYYPSYKSA
jgi:exosortase/archaeosortase family protein